MVEQSRQYLALAAMYQAAGRRLLGHLLGADEALKTGDEARAADRVAAARELIFQVGLQTLDENAAWLILHRARPTEPVLAG